MADQTGTVQLLLRRGTELTPVRSVDVAGLGGLATLPHRDQVVVADRSGGLSFLEGRSLAVAAQVPPVAGDAGAPAPAATSLHVAPGGDFLAVGYDAGFTDLYDLRIGEVPALVTRALVGMVPLHLGTVAAARSSPDLPVAARPVLDLLQTALEHRFRFDIELGDAVSLTSGEYDISL